MTTLLDMPEIRERVLRVSVADYHRRTEGRKTELLRGIFLQKSAKSPLHYNLVEALCSLLSVQIPSGFVIRQEGPLTLADSEPEPDICIVRGKQDDFLESHPRHAELVIEVAVSSLEVDRVKALIYAEAGVPEYWIVCQEERRVEVHREPTPAGYAEHTIATPPAAIECAAVPGIRLNLATFPA